MYCYFLIQVILLVLYYLLSELQEVDLVLFLIFFLFFIIFFKLSSFSLFLALRVRDNIGHMVQRRFQKDDIILCADLIANMWLFRIDQRQHINSGTRYGATNSTPRTRRPGRGGRKLHAWTRINTCARARGLSTSNLVRVDYNRASDYHMYTDFLLR